MGEGSVVVAVTVPRFLPLFRFLDFFTGLWAADAVGLCPLVVIYGRWLTAAWKNVVFSGLDLARSWHQLSVEPI